MKFNLKKLDFNEDLSWDILVNNSNQETIFANSNYLKSSGEKFERLVVFKGSELKAGLYFAIDKDLNIINSDLIIYCSILFKNNDAQKQINSIREKFLITEVIVDYLTKNYNKINLTLYNIDDLRPFNWKNYNNDLDKFYTKIHYTSNLNISEFFLKKKDTDMKLFENLDDKRKNDIKKSISENYKFSCQNNISDFTIILKEMFSEKGVKVSKNFFINSKNLIEKLIELNMCKIFSVQNIKGEVLYYCVFIYNNNKGYYLFGAGKREIMSRYAGTFCLWESMKKLSSLGVTEINLEGVNSPKRGDFKLSFGGNLEKYFELCFKN